MFKNVDEKKLKSIVNEVENALPHHELENELGPEIPQKKEEIKKCILIFAIYY